jgi:hypothetical protein
VSSRPARPSSSTSRPAARATRPSSSETPDLDRARRIAAPIGVVGCNCFLGRVARLGRPAAVLPPRARSTPPPSPHRERAAVPATRSDHDRSGRRLVSPHRPFVRAPWTHAWRTR